MTNALSIKQLTKTYGNGVQALQGIDLDVKQGDFFALLGPNGAGKSTTIGIITSLVTKSSGSVKIFDTDIDENFPLAKSYLGVVPQEFNFNVFMRVIDTLVNQAGYYGIPRNIAKERAEYYLDKLQLWPQRKLAARELSGGMKRRMMIARALLHQPKLLILDEPTAGVDIEVRRLMYDFMREINEQGTTVILTTHYLEEAESLCKNIAIIDHGKIITATTMQAILKQLQSETFILDLDKPVSETPQLAGYPCKLIDGEHLEVMVDRDQQLNEIFDMLSKQSISVTSMRNKANRLEELFLKLTNRKQEAA